MSYQKHFMGPGAFRLLLCLVVLVHHSFPIRMGEWAVYVFFVLSGYWIARMWDDKYSRCRKPVRTFLLSRWLRLAPVFFLCSVLEVVWYAKTEHSAVSTEWLLRQLPIIGSSFGGCLLVPAWSLDVEAQFYLIAPVLLALRGRNAALILMSLATVSLGIHILNYAATSPWVPHNFVLLYLCFFLVGVLMHRIEWNSPRRLAMGSLIVFLLSMIIIVLIPALRHGIWIVGSETEAPLWRPFLACAGAIVVLPFVAYNVRSPSSKGDRLLGNWAYPLYLFHWIPREWYYAHLDLAMRWYIKLGLLLANFAIALIGSYLILRYLDSPIDRLRAKWVRSRIDARCLSSEAIFTNTSIATKAPNTGQLQGVSPVTPKKTALSE